MKKIFTLLTALTIFTNCSSQHNSSKAINKGNSVGTARKTANPNTPYIYENGYLNYTLKKIPLVENNTIINLNELQFHAVSSAMYTKKVMFDRFGKWTKEIKREDQRLPILVWEKVKLFHDNENLYTVYADGTESWTEMYASVLVFDQNNRDCLNDDSPIQSKLITYFSEGIKNLRPDKKFYKVHGSTVKKLQSKRN